MQYGFVVKVKYQGPTTFKGSRWHARLTRSGMNDDLQPAVVTSASGQASPAQGAHRAARAAMHEALGDSYDGRDAVSYGDLSPSEYVFIF